MISYRRALSTVCYVAAIACLAVGAIVWFSFAPRGFGIGLLFIGAIVLLALAIKFDERL